MRSFDIFEVHADGSLFWRVCVSGEYEKDRKLQELKEQSTNQFCALDLAAGKLSDLSRPRCPRLKNPRTRPERQPRRAAATIPSAFSRYPSESEEPIRWGVAQGFTDTLMP